MELRDTIQYMQILKSGEVAKLLGISYSTYKRWVKSGKLKPMLMGWKKDKHSQHRYLKSEILKLMES